MMLGAWKVAPAWRQPLQGCVHADGTVRAQVVNEGHGPVAHIHRLLVELRDRHGIQGVINTSFNTRGEPIVQSLEEALLAADAMNLDSLWLGGR